MFLARERPRVSFAKRCKLFRKPLVYILQKLERTNVECIAKLIKHPHARAVFAEFDERDVVAINVSTQCQVGLTPFALSALASK